MATKHTAIYNDLRSKIFQHEIAVGDFLPAENELMKQYHASRDTVRKALSVLSERGFILKENGKGSRVLDPPGGVGGTGLVSFKEKRMMLNTPYETQVVRFEMIKAPDGVIKTMKLHNPIVYHCLRIRYEDGVPTALVHDYVSSDLIPGLTREQAQESIFEYVEKTLGLKIAYEKKELRVVDAEPETRELLKMDHPDKVVRSLAQYALDDSRIFCYTIASYPCDSFVLVNFSKRDQLDLDNK